MAVSPIAAQHGDDVPVAEESILRRTVEDFYIEGLRSRRFDLIRAVCLPDARLMGVRTDGSLSEKTLDQWSQRFDPANPPFEQLEAVIVKIDMEGTAAQVKILFVIDGERCVTDFLQMLKVEGNWRVTCIIDY